MSHPRWANLLLVCLALPVAARAQVAGPADKPADPPAPPTTDVVPPEPQPEPKPDAIEGEGGSHSVAPFPAPDPAPALTTLLDQTYLSEAEKRDLRIEHGLWTNDDLRDPAPRAKAALIRGAFWDPSLADPAADPLDRADALWRRGDTAGALALLKDAPGARAARLRAQCLLDSGQAPAAKAELEALVASLQLGSLARADEIADAVRAGTLLARIVGAKGHGAMDYQPMLGALAKARDEIDRLSWRANLAEALLLYEKDRYAETGEALEATLTLNPSSAEAWAVLGIAAVDGFDFPRAEAIAARLDTLAGEGGSPESAIILAAVRLRQGEGEAAETILAPWLAKFPAHRRLLAWNAAAAAGRFDFAAADQRLAQLDTLMPGAAEPALIVGKVVAGARQYDEAAGYLRRAATRAPDWAEPATELGLSEMQAGHDDIARAALEQGVALDPFNVRADNSLKLLRELRTYETRTSDHFIVRFKPGTDQVLADEMLPVLEKLFVRVTGNGPGGIDHAPASRTCVELYPDHHWFSVRITGMPELHTIAAATGPVIAMEAPREGPGHKAGPYDWARVVQHEYTHTVTLSRTKNRLPHWFTEAGAVFLEDAPRDDNTVRLLARAYDTDTLFDLDTINVGFVRPKRPSDRGLAYAQGHWMYQYILERWGNQAPLKLMDLYATGVREEQAFEQVLGLSRADFLAQFKAWAGTQLAAWGLRASPATPDIPMLLREAGVSGDSADAAEAGPTDAQLAAWNTAHPDNPFVLEALLQAAEHRGSGAITQADAPLAEHYAAVRPTDPRPHKLLASLWLADPATSARAIPHLEWLDAREQHSSGYAVALARLYATEGDMTRAEAKAARAVQIAPYDAGVREFAATIALRAKDPATAERHIQALIILEPDRAVHRQRLDALHAKFQPEAR